MIKKLAHEVGFTHIKGADLRKLAKLLKERRESIGISQNELGRRSGIGSCVISNYESHKTNMSRKTLEGVCKSLMLDVSGTLDYCRVKLENQAPQTPVKVEQTKIEFVIADDKQAHARKIDEAIKFLKEEGYKLLIPVVDYREI